MEKGSSTSKSPRGKMQLWQNFDTGGYSLIQEGVDKNGKGYTQTRESYKTGLEKRSRRNGSTGVMNFSQRKELAIQLEKPVDAKVPNFLVNAHKDLYTPLPDKMDGYGQYPRPVGKPYMNKIDYVT